MKSWLKLFVVGLVILAAGDSYAQKGRSYSSGSSSSSSKSSSSKSSFGGSSSKPIASSPTGGSSSSKSYGSGSTSSKSSGTSNSSKPSGGGWNPGLSGNAQRQQSQRSYEAATKPAETPKSTYKTPKGVEKPLQADRPEVKTVRNITHERYITYDNRAASFYGSYYGHPQPYNDFFSPFLMGYLLSDAMNSHQRAIWVYNHREAMDDARYNELLRKDAKLQAELDALKAKGVAADPSYVPEQMKDNPDLMYDKDFVDASYNPEHDSSSDYSAVGKFFFWLFIALVAGVLAMGLFWLFFVKDF